ncbi:MAG: TIGR04283 family arsenosugar biosynthesis glycosyltransferase [Deltaproteobacteria bacterium]|nr:TIGR04283 family arsenosugar biosynthesis glycosyltransferase [Deltaproteobacteria bacterium]
MEKNTNNSPLISVVIPALNEEGSIEATLEAAKNAATVEVIVADGGSSDNTAEICRSCGVRVINSPPGRGPQMNAGAKASKGDIILFLHADTLLPSGYDGTVRAALIDKNTVGGTFSFALSRSSRVFSLITFMVNLRSKLMGLPYGDQAIFVRRSEFEKLGGFNPVPIMEDVAFIRALKKLGKIKIVDDAVITSSRRWEKEGWLKTTVRNQVLLYLYLLGVSPERLYRFYKAVR